MSRTVSGASSLIRGGQTTQHWWRMGWQVIRFATVVGSLIYIATFAYLIFSNYDPTAMRIAFYYELAERGLSLQNGFAKPYTFKDLSGATVTMEAVDLYRNTTYRSIRDTFFLDLDRYLWVSLLPALIIGALSFIVFIKAGNKIQENEFVRGAQLVSESQLRKWSSDKWRGYHRKHKGRKLNKPLTISGIPFPPNSVEAQTCIYGTVGVGKSNAMFEMVATIRENGGRCIIYDRMGSFVSRFYDEDTDVLINPFDNRSHAWNPFDDVLDAASFTQLAEVMIPERRGAASDPFWTQAARIVFAYAGRALYKDPKTRTVQHLLDYVLNLPAEKLAQLINNTPAGHFFNEEIEKTAQSIRANLIAELDFLNFLRDDAERFSIRAWMAGEGPSILFLSGDPEHAAATRNIISSMLEISANALMSQGPASEPRCYFFLDEVPTLNRLPFLVSSLAEIRQFGGAFVLGYQIYSQLEDCYGREAAQTIAGTTNNRLVFSTPDFRTAKLCSESLGNHEYWEANSNISVGAHEARDGVGLSQQRVDRPIIAPAEIQNFEQFVCAVKFAYDAPTAIIKMKLFKTEPKQPAFLPYMGNANGFAANRNINDNIDGEPRKDIPAADIVRQFHKWCEVRLNASDIEAATDAEEPVAKYKDYFPHFKQAILAGQTPDNIEPIVTMDDGLMRNTMLAASSTPPATSSNHSTQPSEAIDPDERPFAPVDEEGVSDAEVEDLFSHAARPKNASKPKSTSPKPAVTCNAAAPVTPAATESPSQNHWYIDVP